MNANHTPAIMADVHRSLRVLLISFARLPRLPRLPRLRRSGVSRIIAAAAFAAIGFMYADITVARKPVVDESVAISALPSEAQATLTRVRAGGPFPFERDGIAFGNYERMLPERARGYYREYTVPTPSAKNRGARRIVCGSPPATAECYYSDDHYRSFRRIR